MKKCRTASSPRPSRPSPSSSACPMLALALQPFERRFSLCRSNHGRSAKPALNCPTPMHHFAAEMEIPLGATTGAERRRVEGILITAFPFAPSLGSGLRATASCSTEATPQNLLMAISHRECAGRCAFDTTTHQSVPRSTKTTEGISRVHGSSDGHSGPLHYASARCQTYGHIASQSPSWLRVQQ